LNNQSWRSSSSVSLTHKRSVLRRVQRDR
jgi:hypothetical protein